MDYTNTYKNIFTKNVGYNIHIADKNRYDFVINEVKKNNFKKIIDISSGRGFLIKYLKELIRDINITSTDLHKFNDLDVKFIQLDLSNSDDYKKITETYEFLSCLDVLEHLEEKHIEDILVFFKRISNNFCFGIANHSDIQDGVEVHLIRKNRDWWDEVLSNHFEIVDCFNAFNDKLYCYTLKNK